MRRRPDGIWRRRASSFLPSSVEDRPHLNQASPCFRGLASASWISDLLQAGAPLPWRSRICFKQPRLCLANPEFASSSHAPASLRLALLDSLRRRALAAGQHERARSRAVVHVATTLRCLSEAGRLSCVRCVVSRFLRLRRLEGIAVVAWSRSAFCLGIRSIRQIRPLRDDRSLRSSCIGMSPTSRTASTSHISLTARLPNPS